MRLVLLFFILTPLVALPCSKHDSFETWFKKGLIKIEKDGSITCDANKLGVNNCTEAMLYIHKKHKRK